MPAATSAAPEDRVAHLMDTFFLASQSILLESNPTTGRASAAWTWLKAQGISLEGVARLQLGFFSDATELHGAMIASGITSQEVEASQLLNDPRLAGRLVGPIRAPGGCSILSFWARTVGKPSSGPRVLFKGQWKDRVPALGLDTALTPPHEGIDNLILVESLSDCLLLHAHGVFHAAAVAGSGKRLTATRWETLALLGIRRVTLAFHNDPLGRQGCQAAITQASRAKKCPSIHVLPPESLWGCRTPGDLIREQGVEAFLEAIHSQCVDVNEPEEAKPFPPSVPVIVEAVEEPPLVLEEDIPSANDEQDIPPAQMTDSADRDFCPIHHCNRNICFCFD